MGYPAVSERVGEGDAGVVIAPGVGRMLTDARLAREWTVAQVADKLKLTTRQVEALEAEDLSRLPSAVFVRGFIRNYARLLEISPEALLVDTKAVIEPTETITAPSEELRISSSPMRRWLVLPLLAVVLFMFLVALLYAWLSQGEEAYLPDAIAPTGDFRPGEGSDIVAAPTVAPPVLPPDAPATTPPGAASVDAGSATVVPGAAPAPSPAPLNAPVTPAQPVPATAVPKPVPPAAVAPASRPGVAPPRPAAVPGMEAPPAPPTTPPAAASPAQSGTGAIIQFVAREDAWIEVVSGDNQRFTRLMRAGEQLALRGTPPLKLVVGNAANVQVAYRGRAIDLGPHIGDKVARVTLE